jgi:hypothetical protein
MKLISNHKLKELQKQEPIKKHLLDFAEHSKHPEVFYYHWLEGIEKYLDKRHKRPQASNT